MRQFVTTLFELFRLSRPRRHTTVLEIEAALTEFGISQDVISWSVDDSGSLIIHAMSDEGNPDKLMRFMSWTMQQRIKTTIVAREHV